MASSLRVISGNASLATQYHALLHSNTQTLVADSAGYTVLIAGDKTLIVHTKSDNNIPKDAIAIDPRTHAITLQAASGDKILCSPYNEKVELITNLVIRLKNGIGIFIDNPILKEPLFVQPGITISTSSGIGTVTEGKGLYVRNAADNTKELLGEQNLTGFAARRSSDQFGEQNLTGSMGYKTRSHRNSNVCQNSQIHDIQMIHKEPTTININFCHMGIGGLKEQMTLLIRQVFISRIINATTRAKYQVKDIRGILLYGPPGTGKTLIARNIGKIIPDSIITKINGPELSSKFYGESESNVRKIFEEANRNPNKLHVIIFDEIDAIGRKRGDGSSVHDDKVLTQLLTMIDGLDSTPNVFIIGITNRKDVLDPALTRAGRLECHVEVPLPKEEGRKEILDIYFDPLRSVNLAIGIDSTEWARILDGYSGADIESLISRAKNLAMMRDCDIDDNNIKPRETGEPSPVTHDDLMSAFSEFQPTFSKNDNVVQRYITNYPLSDINELNALKLEIESNLSGHMTKPYTMIRNDATEETRILVSHLANSLNLPYVRYVSYNDFLGKNSSQNCNNLNDAYFNCLQAERAVLILDSLSDVGDRALILRERFITNNPLAQGKQLVIINITNIMGNNF